MIRFEVMKRLTSNVPDNLQDIEVYDVLSIDWSTFKFDGEEEEYYIKDKDTIRPDLLSFKLYDTINYQNIIFIINNIGDLLNLTIGEKIRIPKIQSLKKFMYDNRKIS